MITLILIKTSNYPRHIDYLIDTTKLKDKRLSNLIEKAPKEITLFSKNYWSRLTVRNMTWFEERLYWSLHYSSVELPATVEKIIYINFEEVT